MRPPADISHIYARPSSVPSPLDLPASFRDVREVPDSSAPNQKTNFNHGLKLLLPPWAQQLQAQIRPPFKHQTSVGCNWRCHWWRHNCRTYYTSDLARASPVSAAAPTSVVGAHWAPIWVIPHCKCKQRWRPLPVAAATATLHTGTCLVTVRTFGLFECLRLGTPFAFPVDRV